MSSDKKTFRFSQSGPGRAEIPPERGMSRSDRGLIRTFRFSKSGPGRAEIIKAA